MLQVTYYATPTNPPRQPNTVEPVVAICEQLVRISNKNQILIIGGTHNGEAVEQKNLIGVQSAPRKRKGDKTK